VYPTTPIFSVEQGWWSGDGFPVDSSINRFPKTPADARAQVGKLSFDHIKLMYDDMIWCRDPLPRMARMEEAVMRALIEEGRKRKFFSEVHAPQYADAREMLEAGVDAFAHGILDRAVDPEFVAQMQRQQTMYLPTFCVFEFLADTRGFMKNAFGDPRIAPTLPPGVAVRYNSEEYFQHYKETYPNIGFVKAHLSTLFDNMKTLHEAGIVIPMGTDMWAFPGIGAHLELEYMVEAGMTPSEAIVSCTSAGAKFLKQENIGMIEAGKQADLLILNSDPTKDIRNTRDIDKIVRRGVIYDHAELVAKVKE
jgi:imidazolonepropionase-like amidohydrolase